MVLTDSWSNSEDELIIPMLRPLVWSVKMGAVVSGSGQITSFLLDFNDAASLSKGNVFITQVRKLKQDPLQSA